MNDRAREPRICLNMIVRNEAQIIVRCLASVADVIDCYVIVDTGSTDDTIERAVAFLAGRGIEGEVHRTTFVDFATTRNEALERCRESSVTFDYVLLMDADMELRVDDPEFRRHLGASAYRLRQVSSIGYWNTRLIRRTLAARYVGVTHEYLETAAPPEPLSGIWFLDHEEGSSRADKTERDTRLLRQALVDDPEDARSMFYLAQTLREAGELEEAARWYEARIAAGGWEEEVWYSKWMLARCHGDDPEALTRLCVEAWRYRPTRAEPLYTIARMLRERSEHERALEFVEEGACIGYPTDDLLFVEERIYREGFLEESSICGFYSLDPDRFRRGREACFELSTRRDVEPLTRLGARSNARFYAQRADELFGPVSLRRLDLPETPGWAPMNPSLARVDDTWVGTVRLVNYRIVDGRYVVEDPDNVIRTRNLLVRFTDTLAVEASVEITEPATAPVLEDAVIRGYEDCRLFQWLGSLWFTATVADRSPDALRQMILVEVDARGRVKQEIPLRGLEEGRHEKNWVPLVFGEHLCFIYLSDPTIIVHLDRESGTVGELARQVPGFALEHLRGSSQAVAIDQGWLYLTHEVVAAEPRVYLHRFVHLTSDFRVGAVSEPFHFRRKGIEFAAGLAREGSRLIATFGVEDGEAWLAEFDLAEVLAKLGLAERGAGTRNPGRLTLVSACYDLAKRESDRDRDLDFYRRHGEWVLALDRDLVLFTEPELADEFRERRRALGLAARTVVIPMALESFASMSRLEAIERARAARPIGNLNARKDTPLYTALGWARFEMIDACNRMNPFGATHLAWIDFGIAHVAAGEHLASDAVFDEPADRLRLLSLWPLDSSETADRAAFCAWLRGNVAAGYLPASRAVHEQVCALVRENLESLLADQVAASDEQVLALISVDRPDLVEFTFGDYDAILENHRRLRCSAEHLLLQLRACREKGDFGRGAEIGRRVRRSIADGVFDASAGLTETLREEIDQCLAQHRWPLPVSAEPHRRSTAGDGSLRVVSFSIHGTEARYRTGLLENLETLPGGFVPWVYVGSDVEDAFVDRLRASGATIIQLPYADCRLEFDRLRPLDHPDVALCFVRDADSRINERDRWCMREFEASNETFHVIRDHYWHKSRIMGGTCGARRGAVPGLGQRIDEWLAHKMPTYGDDEAFLAQVVSPVVRPLVHTNCCAYRGETTAPIALADTDHFVGNVYDEDGTPVFRHDDFPLEAHVRWLQAEEQWRLIAHLVPIERASGDLLFPLFQALFYLGRFRCAQAVLGRYRTVTEHDLVQSSHLIPKLAEKVIGTTDVDRIPAEDEVVIVYGNFLHDVDALPHGNRLFRHAIYRDCVAHTRFECHPCWDPVARIYVLNLETRRDRYAEVMAELASMAAPLDRVFHYRAEPTDDALFGATLNHVEVVRDFVASGLPACAIFEDDFTFTSRSERHQRDLQTLWERGYDFDVCLLAASKFHDHRPYDDLLDISFQECTTASGYLLRRESAPAVLEVMEEGLELLGQGDQRGVVDRHWSKLQARGRFYVFKTKFGYQRCGYSNIKGTVTAYFD